MASSSSFASQLCYYYDVFLSFRGKDTRKTFVDHFYSALVDRRIHTYKDDETLPRGETISPSLFKGIKESKIAVIIFSKNYADSAWCLDELVYIMKCRVKRGLVVIPIFYDVEPSEVRKQKGDFGKGFAKQEAENSDKVEIWRKALVDASNIAGWEPKNIANGHESKAIKEIVDKIQDRLLLDDKVLIDENLVGMRARLQELKSLVDIESGGVRMVGIWGIGGGGKTTLASAVYKEISQHFQGYCIVNNVREETSKYGLENLQEGILSDLFKSDVEVQSVEEGKGVIKSRLHGRKVLMVLDDVSEVDQLDALAGSHNWFDSGSRIIITTRHEHVLKTHKVDHIYPMALLSHDEAFQLFKRHAYNKEGPVEDYEKLSSQVVSYAGGLPLAIKVLGSFLYDKEKKDWMDVLARLKDIPKMETLKVFELSYDALSVEEKELFLDIACFFNRGRKDKVLEILEACGRHHEIGIEILRQKHLINIMDDRFYLHDLVQEMGHNIVRGKYPQEYGRLWNVEGIKEMCYGDATKDSDKILSLEEDLLDDDDHHDHSYRFCKSIPIQSSTNDKILRVVMLDGKYDRVPTFLPNELLSIYWNHYPTNPFPDMFQPMKIVVLKLSRSMTKELWKGCKHLPHLKELRLDDMWKLLSTPNFDGLPCLQKLTLSLCPKLEEIHPSFGNHTSLENVKISCCYKLRISVTIFQMINLKTLEISDCRLEDEEIISDIEELSNLRELNLSRNYFSQLDLCLSQLTQLKVLVLTYCVKLHELCELPSSLAILKADKCYRLKTIGDSHKKCKWLCQVSLKGGSIINDGNILLQSMLEGETIENHSMLLQLEGLKIPKGFTHPLLRGRRCRLQLPENWCNDFCGFLMCAVLPNKDSSIPKEPFRASMNQVTSSMDSQDDVVWEESDNDRFKSTFVFSVPFGSLRHTAWWHQTYKALSFDVEDKKCGGFGVKLIAKKNRSGLNERSTNSSEYTPHLKIEHDSTSTLTISLIGNMNCMPISQDSQRQKKQQPLNLHPDFPMITLGPKSDIAIGNYGCQIPKVFHPYISKIKDVKPDGHCGFRSVAVGLGQKQTKYLSIRRQLLMELRMNEGIWRQVFDPENVGHYDELFNRINFHGVGRAESKNYMVMPETGFLIAQRYGVIVHTLDIRGNDTIFPLLGGPDEAEKPHQVVAVVFVDGGHFIHIKLEESYQMPPPNYLWTLNRTESAAAWHDLYKDRMNAY